MKTPTDLFKPATRSRCCRPVFLLPVVFFCLIAGMTAYANPGTDPKPDQVKVIKDRLDSLKKASAVLFEPAPRTMKIVAIL